MLRFPIHFMLAKQVGQYRDQVLPSLRTLDFIRSIQHAMYVERRCVEIDYPGKGHRPVATAAFFERLEMQDRYIAVAQIELDLLEDRLDCR